MHAVLPSSSWHAQEKKGGGVIIGDRVWIGYRASILLDVIISQGAVVAVGAIVSKDVAPLIPSWQVLPSEWWENESRI